MRKILLITMMIFSMVLTVSAQQNVKGNYTGNFMRIYMNGDKPVPTEQFTTTVSPSNSLISLHMDAFQIGNMPGTIEINITNIVLNSDGSFNQTVYNAIKLTIFGKETTYNAVVSGTVSNNVLTYTITSLNAFYLGLPFKAIVGFQGTKS